MTQDGKLEFPDMPGRRAREALVNRGRPHPPSSSHPVALLGRKLHWPVLWVAMESGASGVGSQVPQACKRSSPSRLRVIMNRSYDLNWASRPNDCGTVAWCRRRRVNGVTAQGPRNAFDTVGRDKGEASGVAVVHVCSPCSGAALPARSDHHAPRGFEDTKNNLAICYV